MAGWVAGESGIKAISASWIELGNKNKEGQAQEDNLIISIMHFSLSELKFLLMWQKYLVQITE